MPWCAQVWILYHFSLLHNLMMRTPWNLCYNLRVGDFGCRVWGDGKNLKKFLIQNMLQVCLCFYYFMLANPWSNSHFLMSLSSLAGSILCSSSFVKLSWIGQGLFFLLKMLCSVHYLAVLLVGAQLPQSLSYLTKKRIARGSVLSWKWFELDKYFEFNKYSSFFF